MKSQCSVCAYCMGCGNVSSIASVHTGIGSLNEDPGHAETSTVLYAAGVAIVCVCVCVCVCVLLRLGQIWWIIDKHGTGLHDRT